MHLDKLYATLAGIYSLNSKQETDRCQIYFLVHTLSHLKSSF